MLTEKQCENITTWGIDSQVKLLINMNKNLDRL